MKMTKDQFNALLSAIKAIAYVGMSSIEGRMHARTDRDREIEKARAALTSEDIIASLDTAPGTITPIEPTVTLHLDASDMTDRLDKFEKWWNDQMAEAQTEPPEPRFTYKEWHAKVGKDYRNEMGLPLLATPDAMQHIRELKRHNATLTEQLQMANDKARALEDKLRVALYQRRQISFWANHNLTTPNIIQLHRAMTAQPPPVK